MLTVMVCQSLSRNLLHSLPVHSESRNGIEQTRLYIVINISASRLALVIVVKFYYDIM